MSQRNKSLSSGWLFWKLVKVGAMYMTSNFQSLKWVYSKACVVTFPPCVLILQVESWGTKFLPEETPQPKCSSLTL